MTDSTPLPPAVVQQAIAHYVRALSGQQTPAEAEALARWRAARPEHQHAWLRLQQISAQAAPPAQALGGPAARDVLARSAGAGRRRALKLLVGGAGLGLLTQQSGLWQDTNTTWRTGTAEQRQVTLADGTQLWLNADTRLSTLALPQARGIVLHEGEVRITTATDPAHRPFLVQTRSGVLVPLGTVFHVTQRPGTARADATQVAVFSGAVAVWPGLDAATLLATVPDVQRGTDAAWQVMAGQQASFSAMHAPPPTALTAGVDAWTRGMFSATQQPLGELVQALAPYHTGWLRCDPAIAGLRVTGTWPLPAEQAAASILGSLTRHLPVRLRRITPYWLELLPA